MIEIPLGPNEMRVSYTINHGQDLMFYVPARDQHMRVAAYSVSMALERNLSYSPQFPPSATASVLVSIPTISVDQVSRADMTQSG